MNTKPLIRGGSLVLALLALLGILAIGALAMMSSYSDLKLARTAAERTEGYYELEKLANEELLRVNEQLSSGLNLDGWISDGNSFSRDISLNEQKLHIELLASGADKNGRYYRILQWRQWQDSFEYETGGSDVWLG